MRDPSVLLPGEELIRRGIADLSRGEETALALLVSIGAERLRDAGLPVPPGAPLGQFPLALS